MAAVSVAFVVTNGQVIVDADDIPVLARHSWQVVPGYCRVNGETTYYAQSGKVGSMHRFLLKPPAHLVVDHINGDGLDNRRINLRAVTQAVNAANNCNSAARKNLPAEWRFDYTSIERGDVPQVIQRQPDCRIARLSDSEFEVMLMLAKGWLIKDIAARLNKSPSTVSTYKTRILKKIRGSNNADITLYVHGLARKQIDNVDWLKRVEDARLFDPRTIVPREEIS